MPTTQIYDTIKVMVPFFRNFAFDQKEKMKFLIYLNNWKYQKIDFDWSKDIKCLNVHTMVQWKLSYIFDWHLCITLMPLKDQFGWLNFLQGRIIRLICKVLLKYPKIT